jgi:hypothetical protein
VKDRSWVGCRLTSTRPAGWLVLVEGELHTTELTDTEPLIHYRGRYRTVD